MTQHYKFEKTLVVIKPDGIQRSLIGEIIQRYERTGLKLIGIKMFIPKPEFIEAHYTLDPEWRRLTGEKNIKAYKDKGLVHPINDPLKVTEMILVKLKKYLSSGPVVAMVWQGAHAVQVVRKITGSTEPLMSDVGTIRGDFVLDSYKISDDDVRAVRNLVHASSSVKEAEEEIKHWFKEEELMKYSIAQERILYDVDLNCVERGI